MIIALPHPLILATGHDNDLSDYPRIAPLAAGYSGAGHSEVHASEDRTARIKILRGVMGLSQNSPTSTR